VRVLGIMSGTSIDGVDYALCEVDRNSVRLLKLWSRVFPKALQRRIQRAAVNDSTAHELAQLHHDLGRLYAEQAAALKARAQLVGVHGQTVYHFPDPRRPGALQIGEPAYLAEALRVPVVGNFRAADMAAGGQGAPIATLFHRIVFARRGRHVCVNNLGGISNVTSLDWRQGAQPRVTSFDTGPANLLLDLMASRASDGKRCCDRDGAWARRGRVHESSLARWMKNPFFRKPPPKSTGAQMFGQPHWIREWNLLRKARCSNEDGLATLTEFTARSLALNYKLHVPSVPHHVVLCGGGAKNPTLVERITTNLQALNAATEVVTSDALGWPASAIEPAAFALLAFYRWKNWPSNFASTTGARHAVSLGQISAAE
jgi:anhydro-N-acetylmuramic acid kinase